jgi:hypothetical protein
MWGQMLFCPGCVTRAREGWHPEAARPLHLGIEPERLPVRVRRALGVPPRLARVPLANLLLLIDIKMPTLLDKIMPLVR